MPKNIESFDTIEEAIQEGLLQEKRLPNDFDNLLRNEEYVNNVSQFVLTSYDEALVSHNAQQQQNAVNAAHQYSREALEAIAEHVLNCADNLLQFLDCQDHALDGIVQKVDLIQQRVKRARQLEAIRNDPAQINSIHRPLQTMGRDKHLIEGAIQPMAKFDQWNVDYTRFDNLGISAIADTPSSVAASMRLGNSRHSRDMSSSYNSTTSMSLSATTSLPSVRPGPPPSVSPIGQSPSLGIGAGPPSLTAPTAGKRANSGRYRTSGRRSARAARSAAHLQSIDTNAVFNGSKSSEYYSYAPSGQQSSSMSRSTEFRQQQFSLQPQSPTNISLNVAHTHPPKNVPVAPPAPKIIPPPSTMNRSIVPPPPPPPPVSR